MKDDIKRFNNVCRKNHMTDDETYEFSDYIHNLKDSGYRGSGKNGDFTYGELDDLAKDFLGENDEQQDN